MYENNICSSEESKQLEVEGFLLKSHRPKFILLIFHSLDLLKIHSVMKCLQFLLCFIILFRVDFSEVFSFPSIRFASSFVFFW